MADRGFLDLTLIDAEGDVRANKTLTFYEEDGVTAFGQSLYAAQSGGAALVPPYLTNSLGTFRAYTPNPQRAVCLASDDAVAFPVAFLADPADQILQGQSDRQLASLTVGPDATTDIPLTVSGQVGQTANLQEWKSSAGTVLASVGSTGIVGVGADDAAGLSAPAAGILGLRAADAEAGRIDSTADTYYPSDLFRALRIGTVGTDRAALAAVSTFDGWTDAAITTTHAGIYGAVGAIALDDVKRIRDAPDVPFVGGVVGAIDIPLGTVSIVTNSQGCGVIGFVTSAGARNGVALYGECQATADLTDGGLWGLNVVLNDQGFDYGGAASMAGLVGAEMDFAVDNAATIARGCHMALTGITPGASTAGFGTGTMQESSFAYILTNESTVVKWHAGFKSDEGAALYGLWLGFQTKTGVAATGSQPIVLDSLSAALVPRQSFILANSDGNLLLRGGDGVTRIQEANFDQSVAGTTRLVVNATGIGINLPSEGLPAKVFEAYVQGAGFPIVARLSNYDGNVGAGTALGFTANAGAEALSSKAGLGLERTNTFGRGKLHFLQDNTADASEVALADSKAYMDSDGGWVFGAATGGTQGLGTLNLKNVYKDGGAYTNPDYVLEHRFTGGIERFAENPGAANYPGLLSLEAVEAHAREHLRLPRITDQPAGIFDMADIALEKIEELYLHAFDLNRRLKVLEGVSA